MTTKITDSGHEPGPDTIADDPVTASGVTPERLRNLRAWNLGLTVLHAAQAIAIVVLSGDFVIQVVSTFPEGPPGTRVPDAEQFFDVRVGYAIGLFLALAAIDHLVTATVLRGTYENDLRHGINRFRWVEYSISATIMILLIGFYSGITNITAVVAVIGANVAMILFGWLQERMNPPGRTTTTMMPFWFGAIAGITPWIGILIQIAGSATVPGFVYGIVVVQFVLFFSFALNQWLQYRGVGRWSDYLHGEKAYLVLSLAAKSLLAWQIYFPSLD
jgi:hypothetical protein